MKEKNNKWVLCVLFGFAGGAILGVIFGLLIKNFAVGLTVGVGCGIAIGTSIGWARGYLKKLNQKVISGYIMAIIGFVMIVRNAIAYIFNLDFKAPALTIMGIVFILIGMKITRKSRK